MAASTVAVSTATATEAAAATSGGPYGSGVLGSWATATRAISTAAQIQRVRDTNGVYMFGDSISVQDGKALATRLLGRDGSQLAVHNWSSRPTSGAVDALQEWAERYGLPRRILMASGSNDIFDPPKFAAQVDRAMSIVGQNRTLFWVNIQVVRKAQTAAVQLADQRNSSWLNMQLYDAQEKYPNLRIIRWAEWLWIKPYRLANYLRDGVHPSVPLGQDARNELIVQSLTLR
ncbi:SGNH/GDSL hydrolase family protein [Kribbella swartbergensis]